MTYTNSHLLTDMQHAVELSSRQSVLNATDYGYYAGGEPERDDDFERMLSLI